MTSGLPSGFIAAGVVTVLLCWGMAAGLALWCRRALGQPWRLWLIGAGTFVASQVVHLPMLAGAGPLMRANEASGSLARIGLNVAFLGLAAGLCEELARWLALRTVAKDARTAEAGVMLGAGHGGIEAILIIPVMLAQSIFLLTHGDEVLAKVREAAPEQVPQLEEQIKTLQGRDPFVNLAGGTWERAMAMTLHIALQLMVVRAVRTGRWGWLVLAIGVHAAVDSGAVALMRATGQNVLLVEGALTVVGAACAAFILRELRAARPGSAPPSPTGTSPSAHAPPA